MSNYSGALTVVGYAVGAYFGYPQLGAVVGGVVGGAVDYSQIPDTEGPRLGDAQTISAAYGDVIPYVAGAARLGGQVWWVSARREIATEQDSGKGGGPKNTTFTYEQDVLFGLTSHQIGDVARIWLNGKLIWTQLPDASIDSIIASEETNLWSRITIYSGDSTQLPDPTYEAAVGSGNAPAYRGRCSVFIEGLQLGGSGQMPNLTFEVIKQGLQTLFLNVPMVASGLDTVAPAATTSGSSPPTYTPDGGLFSRSPGYNESIELTTPSGGKLAITDAGKTGVWNIQLELVNVVFDSYGGTSDNIRFFYTYGGSQWGFSYRTISGTVKLFAYFAEGFGASNTVDLGRNFTAGKYRIVMDTRSPVPTEWTVKWYKDGELLLTRATASASINNISLGFAPGDGRGVTSFTFKEVKVLAAGVGPLVIGEPLQGVVEELCIRSGMPPGTYDATALATITKPVRSLVLAQLGATRAALQPLQLAYFFDCTLTDKLYFKPRATSSVATIEFDDLAAGVDKPTGEPFALTQGSDLELPAQVAIRYRNVDNDYQTGVEVSDRLLSGQVAQQSIEVAIGMKPAEAKALADAVVIDNLAGLTRGTVALSMAYAHLMPADVVLIDGQLMRLGRKQDARGVLTFEARRHESSAIISSGVTDGSSYGQAAEVSMPSATVLEVLDIPILRDADDGPGHYVAANGGGTWSGASVQRSINGVDFVQAATVMERAVFGTCTTTLGDFEGVGFDEVNSLGVDVGTGELASATRDALLLDGQLNALLVGGELIRFATATLTGTSPNRYTLTRLLRGQRGTEWAMAGHAASERCVLLRPQGLRYVSTQQTDIGAGRYIKGVTVGLTSASVDATAYTNTGISQKPFSPTNLRVSSISNSSYHVTWQRRSRKGLLFKDGAPVSLPLAESAEEYSVQLLTAGEELVSSHTTSVPSVFLGELVVIKTYQELLDRPKKIGSYIYGLAHNPREFAKIDAASGALVQRGGTASGAIYGGDLISLAYSGTSAYALVTDQSQTGAVYQKKLYRYDLSTMALSQIFDMIGFDGSASGTIHYISGSVWTICRENMSVRQHDSTTLAVVLTNNLGAATVNRRPLTAVIGNVIFIHGKDWSRLQAYDTATNTVLWDVSISRNISNIFASSTALLMYDETESAFISVDPDTGAELSSSDKLITNSNEAVVVGSSLYCSRSEIVSGSTVPIEIVSIDMDTLLLDESISIPSDFRYIAGEIDGTPVVPGGTGMYEFGPGPSLVGHIVRVRQKSQQVGDGYAAQITI